MRPVRSRTVRDAALVVTGVLLATACGDDRSNAPEGSAGKSRSTTTAISLPGEELDQVEEPTLAGAHDAVVPRPVTVTAGEGEFPVTRATALVVAEGADVGAAPKLLRDMLAPVTGADLPMIDDSEGVHPVRAVRFTAGPAEQLGDEGYVLDVRPDGVEVTAASPQGFGWAVQTIRQLLPAAAHGDSPVSGTLALPVGLVKDEPRFVWRGVMLDVARHFFPPEDVEQLIDMAAAYKLNILHLHLSDDQGWRLEIEAYPELTEVGAATEVGGGPGGHYTQEEYTALVDYATDRGITVVPEIDMPGHTNAALVSLPGLSCDGQAPDPYVGTQVGFSSLCIDSELTYEFVETVVGELADLTPGPYIHIGGDEADATDPADYQVFMQRVVGIVAAQGKVPVGWDDMATVPVDGEALVQYWQSPENAVAASEQGMGVIMSPAQVAYLDMKHTEHLPGNTWAGSIDSRVGYEWDPRTMVHGLPGEAVLGLEAPLWTELVPDRDRMQQMLLPRLPGYAELGWSPPEGRFWDEYRVRLAAQEPRWVASGWTYTEDPGVPWEG